MGSLLLRYGTSRTSSNKYGIAHAEERTKKRPTEIIIDERECMVPLVST
jgi:hypothetical protein